MADAAPLARSPVVGLPQGWADLSLLPKWRSFTEPSPFCELGHAIRNTAGLTWSVAPGQWTVLGQRPEGAQVVDLTHVWAMVSIPETVALRALPKVCALDFDDRTFPEGRAARTAVADVATEIVRIDGAFLLATSRSYGAYLTEALISATGTP